MKSKLLLPIIPFLVVGFFANAEPVYADSIFTNPSGSVVDLDGPSNIWTSNFTLIQGQSPLNPGPIGPTSPQGDLSAILESIGYLTMTGQAARADFTADDMAAMFTGIWTDGLTPQCFGLDGFDRQTAGASIVAAAFFDGLDVERLADHLGEPNDENDRTTD
jgi:hypothetical protein